MTGLRTIYKYELNVTDLQELKIPQGYELLSIHMQKGEPMLWALVDPENTFESVLIRTYGTGHKVAAVTDSSKYLGTYLYDNEDLVFHVFKED